MRLRVQYILCLLWIAVSVGAADFNVADTVPTKDSIRTKKVLDHPMKYTAKDSMVMTGTSQTEMFGGCTIDYGEINLTSAYMRMKTDSNLLYARGNQTEEGWEGKPLFKDKQEQYECNEITYNIKTQKGYIRGVVTEQGEGYIISDRTKKHEGTTMTLAGGKYTTCNDHEHPHFYLHLTKAKMVPEDYIATGPAYLVVGDVPLPLAIPFAFFPLNLKKSTGLIMPSFGDDKSQGLYVKGLGYYFAINDYCDLEVKGDIYTKGSWAIEARSRYAWRYHFTGNVGIKYCTTITGEPDMPDYLKRKNFSVQWSHNQDSKANPYCNFAASVNFATSGYNRANIDSYYDPNLTSENTKSSGINYTQRFPDSPWNLSASVNLSQRTRDSTITFSPSLSVNMSTIYPFKRKKPVGKEKWYEKISMSYSGSAKISTNPSGIKEKEFFRSNFHRDWTSGLQHSVPIRASFMLFKYLNVSPSISLRDRMYFQRVDQTWDEHENQVQRDTTYGFYNVFDFNVSMSMSTKLYGYYIPIRKLFPNSRVDRFRHVMTPSISMSYHPDFGAKGWGYYGSYDQPVYTTDAEGNRVQKQNEDGSPMFVTQNYSRFPNAAYGTVSRGASATLGFSLGNNLEVKVVNREDTTGKKPYKVISLIDDLSISGGYNFIADSMNWSNFSVNLRIKFPKLNYTLNLRTSLDPYMYELNAFGNPIRTNKQYWHNGKFPHWDGTGTSLSYTFNNQTIKKWSEKIQSWKKDTTGTKHTYRTLAEREQDEGYTKIDIPWSLSISYSIRYGKGPEFDFEKMKYKMIFTHNLSFNGSLGLGKGWKVSASASYDFKNHCISQANFNITRDLHCWTMTASFVPIGPFKSYNFHIGVNASMLSQLKYDKSSQNSTNKRVDWW